MSTMLTITSRPATEDTASVTTLGRVPLSSRTLEMALSTSVRGAQPNGGEGRVKGWCKDGEGQDW